MAPDMQTSSRTMSPATLERLRLPAALFLILIAGFVLWPRAAIPTADGSVPSPSVVVGEPFGEVIPAETATPIPTPIPTATPVATLAPTPTPTPAPATPPPPPPDAFTAEVLACRSVSGGSCTEQIDKLQPNVGKFTALIRFTDANAGDAMNAILSGPGGTVAGIPYALQGSGDGYFWAEFLVGNLPAGDYVLTATRNGIEVAATAIRKLG
jgi:hypothetical protein